MTKRNRIGKSPYVRNWSNPDIQPEFKNPKIKKGLDLAKKQKEEGE